MGLYSIRRQQSNIEKVNVFLQMHINNNVQKCAFLLLNDNEVNNIHTFDDFYIHFILKGVQTFALNRIKLCQGT